MNKKSNRFSPEMRERAVRMVQEHRGEYPSLWAAIESIAPKVGCVAPTLLEWVKKAEVDSGVREGVTSAEREQQPMLSAGLTACCRACKYIAGRWKKPWTALA
jgi:transposase-like protein